MSRSGIPSTIFVALESPSNPGVPAVIGSDAIYYVDGRYGRERVVSDIYDQYASYLARGYKLMGYEAPGDYSGRIRKL